MIYRLNQSLSNSGGGKKPISWATVVECLRTVELNYLADSIEELFEHDLPQPSSTPQPNGAGRSMEFLCIVTEMEEVVATCRLCTVIFG